MHHQQKQQEESQLTTIWLLQKEQIATPEYHETIKFNQMALKTQYLTLLIIPEIHLMVVLTYEQHERATRHTVNRQAQKDQYLTDLRHQGVRGVRALQETAIPLQVHEVALSIPHHAEAALLQQGVHKQEAVAEAPTEQALQDRHHIHHPDHQPGQVQGAATQLLLQALQEAQGAATQLLLQALQEAQGAATHPPALLPARQEVVAVGHQAVSGRQEDQDNLLFTFIN